MRTTRRRRGPRLAVASVILLTAAAAYVVWKSLDRKTDTYITDEVTHSFDASSADMSGPRVAAAPAPILSAGTVSSLTPILTGPKPKPAAAGPNWGDSPLVRDLVAAPAAFIARKTLLGRADALEKFLADRGRVYRYLSHPLVRGVLDDPRLCKWLASPAVVHGFLASPAMQDRRAVAALAKSDLLKGISRSRGVQAVSQDPQFVQTVLLDPQAMSWLMENPSAAAAIRDLMPALGKAVGTTRR